jgi:hypothetical protein
MRPLYDATVDITSLGQIISWILCPRLHTVPVLYIPVFPLVLDYRLTLMLYRYMLYRYILYLQGTLKIQIGFESTVGSLGIDLEPDLE